LKDQVNAVTHRMVVFDLFGNFFDLAQDILERLIGFALFTVHFGELEISLLQIERWIRLEPDEARHVNEAVTKQKHQQEQTPSVAGGDADNFKLLAVNRVFQRHINEQDSENSQIRSVVNGVRVQSAFDFALQLELARLRERLHEWKNEPCERLRAPVDYTPDCWIHTIGHQAPGAIQIIEK